MTQPYSTWATARMNGQIATFEEGEQNFCEDGALAVTTQTAEEAYNQPNPAFWFWALDGLNPAKRSEIVALMLGRLIAEGAEVPEGTDPIANPAGFLVWHAANCGDVKNRKSCHVVFAHGSRLLLDDYTDLDAKHVAFLQMYFVGEWAAAMHVENGLKARTMLDELSSAGGSWLKSQCTFEEFCNGLVEG